MHPLAVLDARYIWHPFTQMRDWLKEEPIVIMRGQGATLFDAYGKGYLDGNSSIWTNLHGHNHPAINRAIARQLKKIAHSSALGLANEPASLLAEKLVALANEKPEASRSRSAKSEPAEQGLSKVFFSDDGSTAMEVALKLAFQYSVRSRPGRQHPFLTLQGAYHGDTIGAVSLGHIDLFHKAYSGLLFRTDATPAPYCYRCRFNRAKPERSDARDYRKCNWECLSRLEVAFERQKKRKSPYAAFVFEPLVQGAAGLIPQPAGWLGKATGIARGYGALLIADEVMTAFGRTGMAKQMPRRKGHPDETRAKLDPPLLACRHEDVEPDLVAVAKGLTGGYLPMAATLINQKIFDAFLGEYEEFKTFFHGHSFTANQLGAAASLASLKLLQTPASIRHRRVLEQMMRTALQQLWSSPNVGDIRQVGLVAGVELVRDWSTREPFDLRVRAGMRVCDIMATRGVLTRPIGNVIVLMPPYCTTGSQLASMVDALSQAIRKAFN